MYKPKPSLPCSMPASDPLRVLRLEAIHQPAEAAA
jgi:hypothetical protein